jgi:Protein of unknown function (DUF3137)
VAEDIDLANLDDSAFARLYKERIEPCFSANEEARVAAAATFKRRALIAGALTLAAAAIAFALTRTATASVFLAAVGVIGGLAYAYQPLAKLSRKLKQEYCSAIAQAMDASFEVEGFQPAAFERIKALGLVPGFTRSKFEDHFTGAHKGAHFDLYEAHLEQRRTDGKGRTRYDTVFRGQLLRLTFPRAFLGTTIVRRDAGMFNMFGGGGKLERVRLVSAEFERAFEVWSNDQVEARYLLHPVMMERLIDLEQRLHGKRIRCAFEGGDLLIAVEGGNLFEPGDMFKPLVDPARARRIVDEIAGVVRVMDAVLTAQAARS